MFRYSIFGFLISFSLQLNAQILPNSPLAYKKIMTAKKTNMCYIVKSKVEDKKIMDTLVFNFKDFIYRFETQGQSLVQMKLSKILKNYSDCKGRGGLKIEFSVGKNKSFYQEKYCADPKKKIGKDLVYTCFFVEKNKKPSCMDVYFFKQNRLDLDKQRTLAKKDFKIIRHKKSCL